MMRTISALSILALLCLAACGKPADKRYPYRWVYASNGLRSDEQATKLKDIIQTASEHGLNGILLSCGADNMDHQPPEYFTRLADVKAFADQHGVEIIPSIFSVGYGGSIMSHDPNLAEGLPVMDALYVVKGDQAVFVPDSPEGLVNGSFEKSDGDKAASFDYQGEPGKNVFLDKETVRDGKVSLRFETVAAGDEDDDERQTVALSQVFSVTPHRTYRVSAWIKTAEIDSSRPFGSGNVRIKAYAAEDNHQLEWININAPTNGDWFHADLGFNSLGYDKVKLSLGPGGRAGGKLWIDGVEVREVGLVNVLRRDGTPLTVKGEKSGVEYSEGQDYAAISDPQLNFEWGHDSPTIAIIKGGKIKNGERLRVSYYHGTNIYNGQTPICMSEPRVYDIWRTNAKLMVEKFGFKKFHFAMDEIRAGGTCAACKARGMTIARIFGDCVTKAHDIIKEADPEAQVFIWSDMLDPNHNAGDKRSYYYHVPENFYGAWNYVPKDMVIACWYYEMRDKSLPFFSGLGYKTIAASYYDADDLENPKGWLESLGRTQGAVGIMYTTWLSKYALLPEFGDLVNKAEMPKL